MIARWPWGNAEMDPDDDALTPDPPCEPTVDLPEPEPSELLDPDGHPIPSRPPHPVGFHSAKRPEES